MVSRAVLGFVIAVMVIVAGIGGYYLLGVPSETRSPFPDGSPPAWRLNVTGNVDSEKSFTLSDLRDMPLVEFNATVGGVTSRYQGVLLLDFVVNYTGMQWDTGPIAFHSKNGSVLTTNIYDIWYDTKINRKPIYLVFARDGYWMTEAEGTAMIIAPAWTGKYLLENVVKVDVGLWVLRITGKVDRPFVVTGKNITSFAQQSGTYLKMHLNVYPQTNSYVGAKLSDVLAQAQRRSDATLIYVKAADGVTQPFPLAEIPDDAMTLIGYKKDGNYLSVESGGPFFFVQPNESYSQGKYWGTNLMELSLS